MMKLVDGALMPLTAADIAQRVADDTAWSTSPSPRPPLLDARLWLERLSPAKQLAISAAGISNPQINLWLLKAAGAQAGIDVTLQETKDGVAALVSAGVLTTADQAILLSP